METLTEQSVPQYTASNIKIVKQQLAWCSVRKLQAKCNSVFVVTQFKGVFVPVISSQIEFDALYSLMLWKTDNLHV